MKKYFLLSSFVVFILLPCFGQQAMFDALFFKQGERTLVENTLSFDGTSVMYEPKGENIQAHLEITQIVSDSTQIVDYQKFQLFSPLFPDGEVQDFLDRQRFSLLPGNYQLEITIADLVQKGAPVSFKQPLIVPSFQQLSCSSFELLAGLRPDEGSGYFHKGGFLTEPYVSDYFPPETDKLIVYLEVYNAHTHFGDSGKYVLQSYVSSKGNPDFQPFGAKITLHKANEVEPIIRTVDIAELPSGNYQWVLECRNSQNQVVFWKSKSFTRNNPEYTNINYDKLITTATFVAPIQSLETLREYIQYLRPIATVSDRDLIDNQEEYLVDLETAKRFFYGFWLKRNPQNPALSWSQYKQLVSLAMANFGNKVRKGYETDRGRIFLKYGPPNVRVEQPSEPEAVPYEIWHYYRLGKYTNRRFVFYNPDVVTNEYYVLHSDVPGEVQNSQWLDELYKKTVNSSWSKNAATQGNPYGRRALELFNNPR